jgi:hypothetical protein
MIIKLSDRSVLKFSQNLSQSSLLNNSSNDVVQFVNSLITNDITGSEGGFIYSCLLTPQGRFLYDFFVIKNHDGTMYIDIASVFKDKFVSKMTFYDLKKKILIEDVSGSMSVYFSFERVDGFYNDPRLDNFGYRAILPVGSVACSSDGLEKYNLHRVLNLVCDGHKDLEVEKSIILEYGFDRLNAISFTKGCYLGQELITRTKHRGEVRKKVVLLKRIDNFGFNESGGDWLSKDIKKHDKVFNKDGLEVGFVTSEAVLELSVFYLALVRTENFIENDIYYLENSTKLSVVK